MKAIVCDAYPHAPGYGPDETANWDAISELVADWFDERCTVLGDPSDHPAFRGDVIGPTRCVVIVSPGQTRDDLGVPQRPTVQFAGDRHDVTVSEVFTHRGQTAVEVGVA